MKNVLKILVIILAITSLCLFAACGGEPSGNDPSSSVTDSESGHGGEQTDTEMKLNLGYVVLEVGETADLVVLNYGGGAITWTSSNPSVCEVSGGALTAKAEGGAIITASAGNSSATCRVVVQNQGIVAVIEVENPEINIFLGTGLNIGAKVTFKGKTVDAVLTYISENVSVATVDENGRVTGVGAGETYVNVYDNDRGLTETVKVKVINY